MGIALALAYAVLAGSADFLGGHSGRSGSFRATTAVAFGAEALLIVALLPLLGGSITRDVLMWGVFVGASSAVSGVALFAGIGRGEPTIVAPLSAVVSAIIPLVIGLITGTVLDHLQWFGVALAIAAVFAVTRQPATVGDGVNNIWFSLVAGMVAGVAISGIYIGADATNEHGIAVLAPAGVLAALFLTASLVVKGARFPTGAGLSWSVMTGVVMALGLAAFATATAHTSLQVVAVVGSLYPATTVALAAVVWRQRPLPAQWAGMGMAIGALALIAA